jgi:hypothetical protein
VLPSLGIFLLFLELLVIAQLCERAIWYEMLRVLLPGGTFIFVVTTLVVANALGSDGGECS